MAIEWKDTTSYSRGEARNPTCWSAKIGSLRLSVLTGHIYYPGKWVMRFDPFYDVHALGNDIEIWNTKMAQERALKLARAAVEPVFKALDSAVGVVHD